MQATIPVKLGGLGVHSAVEVASPACLALLHATSTLVEATLPVNLSSSSTLPLLSAALLCWS